MVVCEFTFDDYFWRSSILVPSLLVMHQISARESAWINSSSKKVNGGRLRSAISQETGEYLIARKYRILPSACLRIIANFLWVCGFRQRRRTCFPMPIFESFGVATQNSLQSRWGREGSGMEHWWVLSTLKSVGIFPSNACRLCFKWLTINIPINKK